MNPLRVTYVVLLLWSCTFQKERVAKTQWKYQAGYHIGDVVSFDSTRYFTTDGKGNIFKRGMHVGVVKKVTSTTLQIASLENQMGFYVCFGEVK